MYYMEVIEKCWMFCVREDCEVGWGYVGLFMENGEGFSVIFVCGSIHKIWMKEQAIPLQINNN